MKTYTINISRPTGMFGSAITETTIGFPAQRLTVEEAKEFLTQLQTKIKGAE